MKVIKFENVGSYRPKDKYAIRKFGFLDEDSNLCIGWYYVDHCCTRGGYPRWRRRGHSGFNDHCLIEEEGIVEKWHRVKNWKRKMKKADVGTVINIDKMIQHQKEIAERTEEEQITDSRIERMGNR